MIKAKFQFLEFGAFLSDAVLPLTIIFEDKKVNDSVKQQYRDNIRWIEEASRHNLVVGSQARILYSDQNGRVAIAVAINQGIAEGRIKGPVVLSRDHHDVSGTDSPYRETSNIYDGSALCADMAVQNFVGDAFRGATWVALHNGGGVGWTVFLACQSYSKERVLSFCPITLQILVNDNHMLSHKRLMRLFCQKGSHLLGIPWGEVINGGFGLVLDGSTQAEERAKMMLSWDVSNGVARRCWSGNDNAYETICQTMDKDKKLKVTLPHKVVDDNILKQALLTLY
ncbi:UNVERIFIED_CONTAM: Urocanate hydratase [Gekko kuhli]